MKIWELEKGEIYNCLEDGLNYKRLAGERIYCKPTCNGVWVRSVESYSKMAVKNFTLRKQEAVHVSKAFESRLCGCTIRSIYKVVEEVYLWEDANFLNTNGYAPSMDELRHGAWYVDDGPAIKEDCF